MHTGADDQRWPKVSAALKRGYKEDGPVCFVLERRLERCVVVGRAVRSKIFYADNSKYVVCGEFVYILRIALCHT